MVFRARLTHYIGYVNDHWVQVMASCVTKHQCKLSTDFVVCILPNLMNELTTVIVLLPMEYKVLLTQIIGYVNDH
jgi:hypothetical protein